MAFSSNHLNRAILDRMMPLDLLLRKACALLAGLILVASLGFVGPSRAAGWKVVLADEFNRATLDRDK